MNNKDFVVFDFETGGLNPDFHEAVQVAGKAYNARSLEPYPASQGGEINLLMKPLYPDRLDPKALAVNGRTVEELMKAPDQKVGWQTFVSWVARWNKNPKSDFMAPIACGKNIRTFDLLFAKKLNILHCPKKEKTVLFDARRQYDVDDILLSWFENSTELANEKLGTVLEYHNIKPEGELHDAMVDVRCSGELLMSYLKLCRHLKTKVGRDGKPMIDFQRKRVVA